MYKNSRANLKGLLMTNFSITLTTTVTVINCNQKVRINELLLIQMNKYMNE